MVVTPCPCPMHIVARPSLAPWSRIRCKSVVAIRAPLAPSGWPIAIAPPRRLTFSSLEPQQLEHGQDLNGERFVELEAIDLIEREPGPLERFLGRRDRPDAHFLGIDAGDGHGADAGDRLQPQLPGLFLGHDQAARPLPR